MTSLNNFFSLLQDYCFAKRCDLCGDFNDNNNLCFGCFANLEYLTLACKKCQQPLGFVGDGVDVCQSCIDKPLGFFEEMICPLIYNHFLKKYIVMFKNQNFLYLSDVLCRFLYNKAKASIRSNSLIAPVPLYRDRLFSRGYNQSLLLAKSFARFAGIPCVPDLFQRIRNTNSQANKTIAQREENVKGAFVFNKKYSYSIKNKDVLIIDDIITTGATIFECAKVLVDQTCDAVKLLAVGRRVKGWC